MSNNKEQSSFLTDDHPEQTLENCHRMLALLWCLDWAEPIDDYAAAGIVMLYSEVGDALKELGDTYKFVKKEVGGES